MLGTDGTSPCGLADIRECIRIASKSHGISEKYFEKQNKSTIKTGRLDPLKRKNIIKKWQIRLDELAVRADLKGEIKKQFLKSKWKLKYER